MERIVKLLFATTLLSIFAYVLIFTSLSRAGNGGEYWGFDGYIEPRPAALKSYEAGDYRFLTVDIRESGVSPQILTPNSVQCFVRSSKQNIQTRRAVVNATDGDSSRRFAWRFADEYNDTMTELLYADRNIDCEHPTD